MGAAHRRLVSVADRLLPLLLVVCAAGHGCGGDSADLTPIRLTHSPPVAKLDAGQLRALSMECEKYPANGSMRGRYDAVYCQDALAAWADAPLQMVPLQEHDADSRAGTRK